VRLWILVLAITLTGCAAWKKKAADTVRKQPPLLGRFDLYEADKPRLFIWDTHPVHAPELVAYVCETMQNLGFRRTTSGDVELLVNIQVLALDRDPKVRILVVEGLEKSQLRRVWIGQTTISADAERPDLDEILASLERDPRIMALEKGLAKGNVTRTLAGTNTHPADGER